MTKLKFTDGVEIDTSGKLRTLHLHDGWYVTGEGVLYPCKDEKEALQVLKEKANIKDVNISKPK
ncbi:MAG: hypothetical protein WDZ47_01030 [Bacteroidales bacterium]